MEKNKKRKSAVSGDHAERFGELNSDSRKNYILHNHNLVCLFINKDFFKEKQSVAQIDCFPEFILSVKFAVSVYDLLP